ncbi:Hypothetical protein GLP15_3370 [Giardia lamblia P15]|uniref:Uncharacterized protein n=1 Tax=Giardia intestinalis (strain P15) TaxID=658858 RepID=E1EVW7_GIAIA|nr:Hypothetical protein GLP15_3370 [Giardia lamblia P15]
MDASGSVVPLGIDEDLKRLITGYTNLISSEETLDDIRSQVSFATKECLLAFIKVAENTGKNYKDAQSCRIVELVSLAVSKSKLLLDAEIQTALAEFSISRCSSLLEAGAVAEHLLPLAGGAFLSDQSFAEVSLMRRYMNKLLKLSPRITYSKVVAKKNICTLLLDWLETRGESSSSGLSGTPRTGVDLVAGYKAGTELLKTLTLAFRGERSGAIIFLVAKLITVLRTLIEYLHFAILLVNKCLCPTLNEVCGLSLHQYSFSISEDDLSKLHDDADENVFEFLIEYLPLEYSPDPDDNLTADELRAALLSALIHPSGSERLYQMIAERVLETDTEEERRQLFLTLEASLTADARVHSSISAIPAVLTTVLNSDGKNAKPPVPLSTVFLGLSNFFEKLFQETLPEALGHNLPSLQAMFTLLAEKTYSVIHSRMRLPDFSNLHLSAEHLNKLQESTTFSQLLTDLFTNKLAVSLTPAGYADDLFYQITNELIYDQFPSADRPAKESLLLMLSHYDTEVASAFSAHLEDTIKREISMGSTENMKIFSSNCKLLCTYCKLDQGKEAFSTTFFNLLVEHLTIGDVIEGSLFIEILNECMILAEGYALQTCKFMTLFSDATKKHWIRFGLRTHVLAISFSNCHLISDPLLSSQLLETIQMYIDTVPSLVPETLDDLLCILRYYYALSSVGLDLPVTHPSWKHIISFCQSHVPEQVMNGLKTSLLSGVINYAAGTPDVVKHCLCSVLASVDLYILRAMQLTGNPSLPFALSALNEQNTRIDIIKAFEDLLISAILVQNRSVLALVEDLLDNAYFQTLVREVIDGASAGRAVASLVEGINGLAKSVDSRLHAQVIEHCLHLSMRLHLYIFDSHPNACALIEKSLKYKLPNALFIAQYLSQHNRPEYIKICAQLTATEFDAQYCTLIAMNSLTWCSPEEMPMFISTVNRLLGTVTSLGVHGPYIVSALTRFVLQTPRDIDLLHSFLSSVLKVLKSTDRPAFYAAILILQETNTTYAYQLISEVISLNELLEGLPSSTLCGAILEQRVTSRQLDQEGILVLLEKSMRLLKEANTELVHCCALIVAAIGRLRYGLGADPVAYSFLESERAEVANQLGSLLNAPLRSTRDAIRAARLIWMQTTT